MDQHRESPQRIGRLADEIIRNAGGLKQDYQASDSELVLALIQATTCIVAATGVTDQSEVSAIFADCLAQTIQLTGEV